MSKIANSHIKEKYISIIITNITQPGKHKEDSYQIRINHTIICEFTHERKVDGLADCLLQASKAVDKYREFGYADQVINLLKLEEK